MSDKMLGKRIAELRYEKGLLQAELAEILNMSASIIGMWERGLRDPDTEMLSKLAEYFNVTTDYLLGISNERRPGNVDVDDDVRLLARDIQDLDPGKRELLKGFIDAMRETGREAKKKK